MKTLHLVLTGKWFDMIASGEKKEEHRLISEYWLSRLIDSSQVPIESPNEMKYHYANMIFDHVENGYPWHEILPAYYSSFKFFDTVTFQHGYSKTARRMIVECKGIDIGPAKNEWSDGMQGDVFRIKLGDILTKPSTLC